LPEANTGFEFCLSALHCIVPKNCRVSILVWMGSNQIVFAEFVRWRFSMGREEGIGVIPSLPFFFVFFNEYVGL